MSLSICILFLGLSTCQLKDAGSSIKRAQVGGAAPDILLEGTDGGKRSLRGLKGKIVLVDFWASWCSPCRIKNPLWVKLYHDYKDQTFKKAQGFEIYSVSFDRNAESWKRAILQDRMEWQNHVIDPEGSKSKSSQMYGVEGIPMNYLINENGRIVAKNWKYEQIEQWLYEQSDPKGHL